MVLETLRGEIVGCRSDLHEVSSPGTAKRHGRLVEEDVDVERPVRLAVAARLRLRDEPDDRCVALGERRLVGEVGGGSGGQADGRHGTCGEHESHGTDLFSVRGAVYARGVWRWMPAGVFAVALAPGRG